MNFFERFHKCPPLMKIVFAMFLVGGNCVLMTVKIIRDFPVFWYVLGYNALVLVLFSLMIRWSKKF